MKVLFKSIAITILVLLVICILCVIIAVAYHFAPRHAPWFFAGIAVYFMWKCIYKIIKLKDKQMNHDISHCQGIGEDLCLSCHRYQAHLEAVDLDYDYVWYMTPPAEATSDSCPYYWEL